MPRTAPATAMQAMTIRVDTREQSPFDFASVASPVIPFTTVRATLQTGDYDLAAFADAGRDPIEQIVVERKSLSDLYGSLGHGRERFEREFQRMADYGYAAVVIESDWLQIMRPNDYLRHPTLVRPKSVVQTLLAWSQRYEVHVYPCPGRRFAEQLTHRMLERWARDHER